MSIFKNLEAPALKVLSPIDWELADCKKKLRVQFRALKKRPDCVSVSVRLGGVTSLKIGENGKTSVHVLKSVANIDSILAMIQDEDELILEARDRYIDSLNIARTTRNTTRTKPRTKKVEQALVANYVTTSAS
jgi:hypothetical protein